LELSAQGLTQQEIADRLGAVVTQRTVSRDLEYLQRESQEYIREHNKYVALEYRKVLSGLQQLNKMAWDMLNKEDIQTDPDRKLAIMHAIQHILGDIMHMYASAEPINIEQEQEILQDRENHLNKLQQGNSNGSDASQAVF
jgi:hypothetical protein